MHIKKLISYSLVITGAIFSITSLSSCSDPGNATQFLVPKISPTTTQQSSAAESVTETEGTTVRHEGFITENGKSYFYTADGELMKDGIVGDGTNGYYYADAEGVIDTNYCNGLTIDNKDWKVINGSASEVNGSDESDKTLFLALKAVGQCTNSSMTKEEKLRACFDYIKTSYLEGVRHDPPYNEMDWPVIYANDIFVYGKGDCFSYGAAFAFMGKALGCSECYACNSGGHGWAEIESKVYDPEWDMHHNEYNHFAVGYDDDCDVNYSRGIEPGAPWMRVKV